MSPHQNFRQNFLLLTIYVCIRLPPKRRWWEGTQLISNSILKSCLRPVRDCFSDYFIFSSWLAFYRGSDERHFLIRKDISYGLSTGTVHRQLPFENMKNKRVNLFSHRRSPSTVQRNSGVSSLLTFSK